jgi:AcrR family transcriptional regulator
MSISTTREPAAAPKVRRRLTRAERYRQLIEVAWRLVREEGSDALTLGRLAEQSDVAKPVVYDHFGSRASLLAALYREYDDRQTAAMARALDSNERTLTSGAAVIASAYVDCVLSQGREIAGLVAALAGSPELEKVRHDCEVVFAQTCRAALAPFAPGRRISSAGLCAFLGAAEALSYAAVGGDITARQAKRELSETIIAMVERQPSRRAAGAGSRD